MIKGAPSLNPSGIAKARTAPGYDGQVAYGGILDVGEQDLRLTGTQRWKTVANMYRRPPVAIWARLRDALFSGIGWSATENEAGGKDAKRGLEVVEQGLLKARFGTGANAKPWAKVAARAINGAAAVGHSVHATAIGRRSDGLVVYTDIAHRPQNTLEQWLRERQDDESTPFVAVVQRARNGQTKRLDLDECLYVVNDNGTNSDAPIGAGMLFLIAERVRMLGVYEPLEGSELASSMGGIPVTRVPLEEMKATLKAKLAKEGVDENAPTFASKLGAALLAKLKPLREFVGRRYKDPSKLAWYELDSATYPTTDGNPTNVPKWGLEIVKGEQQGLEEMNVIITREDLNIARMLGVEHVFIGGGDTAGTYGAHESKITALGAAMNAEAGLFAFVAGQQLARRIVRSNGLDPDTATPTLVPSPMMRTDVARAVDALVKLNMAGLKPNHPAKKAVFEGLDLPYEPEDELILPRLPYGGGQPIPGDDPPKDPPEDDPKAKKPAEDPGEKEPVDE